MSTSKSKFAIHWENQPKYLLKQFCSLMQHQTLVDVLITCGNNSVQVHKLVLAANSQYFREEFEKNPAIEQIDMTGCEFSVLQNILELMYCGFSIVSDDSVKYLCALLKLFQMKSLEGMFEDHPQNDDSILIPKPKFSTKKPKYPEYFSQKLANGKNVRTSKVPPTSTASHAQGSEEGAQKQVSKPVVATVRERKQLRLQAEQACLKEAQASRLALASLQKEISASPQVNSFIIEGNCTVTTVENFIPLNPLEYVAQKPRKLTGRGLDKSTVNFGNPDCSKQPPNAHGNNTSEVKDKLRHILGSQLPSDVEIMFKNSKGEHVALTEEVLQSLSTKESILYQFVDEYGQVGQVQELGDIEKFGKILENTEFKRHDPLDVFDMTGVNAIDMTIATTGQPVTELVPKTSEKLDGQCIKNEKPFSPDMFFADIPSTIEVGTSDMNSIENIIRNAEIEFAEAEDLTVTRERQDENMEICD